MVTRALAKNRLSKRRVFHNRTGSVNLISRQQILPWAGAGIFALGGGSLALRLVHHILSHSKKVLHWPRHLIKVWVNINRRYLLTRKPTNTRMGKGKGARAGRCARLRGGALLMACGRARAGQLTRLQRWLNVRVPFQVCSWPLPRARTGISLRARWAHPWCMQPWWFYFRLLRLEEKLFELHRPGLLVFLMRTFNWRLFSPKGGLHRENTWLTESWAFKIRRRANKHCLRFNWWNFSNYRLFAYFRIGKSAIRKQIKLFEFTKLHNISNLNYFDEFEESTSEQN